MIKFEWFDWAQILKFDRQLLYCDWVAPEIKKRASWALVPSIDGHHRNRALDHDPYSPWGSLPSRWPIPVFDHRYADRTFSDCFDQAVADIVQQHQHKKIYVLWSGGIDSTTVICALIKCIPTHLHKDVKILLSQHSIIENRVFYHSMILPRFEIIDIDHSDLTKVFGDDDAVIFDGEGGNQINLGFYVYNRANAGDWQWLDQNWQDLDLGKTLEWHSPAGQQILDAWVDSVSHSPVPIRNLYELLWWVNFVFKFEQVMYKKPVQTYSLYTDTSFHDFITQKMLRPYAHEIMQQWSMCSVDKRQWHDKRLAVKYFQRKYIYDVDHNEFYFRFKHERGSGSAILEDLSNFALDTQGNIYNFSNKQHRRQLKTWLQT